MPAPVIPPMGFGAAVSACFSKYITFSGRARRAEYWYWTLFVVLVNVAAVVLPIVVPRQPAIGLLSTALYLVLLLPGFAVLVRRLHDTDHSGWWFLLPLTIIGSIVLLVWMCQEGTKTTNRFGPRTT
jgi:uncharacterized membrane protein YhaH (DUF805 family)